MLVNRFVMAFCIIYKLMLLNELVQKTERSQIVIFLPTVL